VPADLERQAEDAEEGAPDTGPAKPFLSQGDYREIEHLMVKVRELGLNEVTIRRDDLTLGLKADGSTVAQADRAHARAPRTEATPAAAPAPEPAAEAAPGPCIEAPLNGTFYRSGGPDKPELAQEGDTVKEGDPVCIVEAMKLFNQIKAPCKCRIVRFLVSHGDAVTKGQPLASIEEL
jgi:acetyl-CoA carboxylase biotin carboxyl carrier protein